MSHVTFMNCGAGAPTPACLWPARRTRSRRSSPVVHDTAPIPGIIIPGARGKDSYGLFFRPLRILFFMENTLIAGFVEIQHEPNVDVLADRTE